MSSSAQPLQDVVLDYYKLKIVSNARTRIPRHMVESDTDLLRLLLCVFWLHVVITWRVWMIVSRKFPVLASLVSLMVSMVLVLVVWIVSAFIHNT